MPLDPKPVAIRVHAEGGPEMLRVEQSPPQEPGPRQVRVRMAAAGVNYIDVLIRSGGYQHDRPYTAGVEGAGVVESVGPDVSEWALGDRVAIADHPGSASSGTYATWSLAEADALVEVPEHIDLGLAAAALYQGLTAHVLATAVYELGPGHTCLVSAAAGGVGHLLVQIAKLRGARVIGAVSDQRKAAAALRTGADAVVLYESCAAGVRAATAGRGVDVVYDGVGRDIFAHALESLRRRGTLVSFGHASGPVPPLDILELMRRGSLFLTRVATEDYLETAESYRRRAAELFEWIGAGRVQVHIGQRLPLVEARQAHEVLESRGLVGKTLLEIE